MPKEFSLSIIVFFCLLSIISRPLAFAQGSGKSAKALKEEAERNRRLFLGLDDPKYAHQTSRRVQMCDEMIKTLREEFKAGNLDTSDPTAGNLGSLQHLSAALFGPTDLGTLVRSTNPPSDLAQNGNYYAKLTQDYEKRLSQRIIASKGNLAPADVTKMALEVTNGNYTLAILTAHNLMKNIAYKGRDLSPNNWPYVGSEDFLKISSKLVNLRGDPGKADKFGPWYHMFGVLFVGSITNRPFAESMAAAEQFSRYLLNLEKRSPRFAWVGWLKKKFGISYSGIDNEKADWDRCAMKAMKQLHPVIYEKQERALSSCRGLGEARKELSLLEQKISDANIDKITAPLKTYRAQVDGIEMDAQALSKQVKDLSLGVSRLTRECAQGVPSGGAMEKVKKRFAEIENKIASLPKNAGIWADMSCELLDKAKLATEAQKCANLAANANKFSLQAKKYADEAAGLVQDARASLRQIIWTDDISQSSADARQQLEAIPARLKELRAAVYSLSADKAEAFKLVMQMEDELTQARKSYNQISNLIQGCPVGSGAEEILDSARQSLHLASQIDKQAKALEEGIESSHVNALQALNQAEKSLPGIAKALELCEGVLDISGASSDLKGLKASLETMEVFSNDAKGYAGRAAECAGECANLCKKEELPPIQVSGYPEVIPAPVIKEEQGPYSVFLLTNASYGLYLGSEQGLKGKSKCSFGGGGIDCGPADVIKYESLLGPFKTLPEAQSALCQNITERYVYPLGIGLKGQWQGDDKKWYGLWEESVSFDCKAIAQAQAPAGSINIKEVSGEAQYERAGTLHQLIQNILLKESDAIKTGDNSKIELSFPKGKITLGDNSEFRINRLRPQAFGQLKFALQKGRLLAEVSKDIGPNFNIKTPTAGISVTGTKFAVIIKEDNSTDVLVYEGRVKIENESLKKEMTVEPGKKINVSNEAISSPQAMNREEQANAQAALRSAVSQAVEGRQPQGLETKPVTEKATPATGLPAQPAEVIRPAEVARPAMPAESAAAILSSPTPWSNAKVREFIDIWLRTAKPKAQLEQGGGWSYDEWGRAYNNTTIKKPAQKPETTLERYQYLWGISGQLNSIAHLSLREYVQKALRGESIVPKIIPAPVKPKPPLIPEPPRGTPTGTAVGQAAPGFNTADIYGKRFDITQLRSKAVVIIFWTDTHDPPSRLAISSLEKFTNQFSKEDLNVVSICMREAQEDLKSFTAAQGLDYIHLLDAQWTIGKSYNLNFLPQIFVLDPSGVIKFSGLGKDAPNSADFQNALRQAVEEARQYGQAE